MYFSSLSRTEQHRKLKGRNVTQLNVGFILTGVSLKLYYIISGRLKATAVTKQDAYSLIFGHCKKRILISDEAKAKLLV